MPPRVGARAPLAAADALLSPTRASTSAALPQQNCLFSTTPCREHTNLRRWRMFKWINSRAGRELAESRFPQYVTGVADQPFPNNPLFRSEKVVHVQTRRLIYDRAMQQGQALKVIAAEMGLDVRRVAAIVRLQEAENQWVQNGNKLATPYARAVTGVLPRWNFVPGEKNAPFEPVNDVHVHRHTMQQLFVPVAESRVFTRRHAAAAFYNGMLPAQSRSPQQGLITMERKNLEEPRERKEHWQEYEADERAREDAFAAKLAEERAREEAATQRVMTDRYEFRFREMNVDDVGGNGRSAHGVGWRYGAPHMDRKRGMIKIPKSVP